MKKKLNLKDLRVSSFMTATPANNQDIKGGIPNTGGSFVSCNLDGCTVNTGQSCTPEICMAGPSLRGEIGC